jgi:hypothetical protein
MKQLLIAGFALVLLVPACAFAQTALNGTWKTDLNSMKGSGTPLVIHLKDGMFANNGHPPIKVKADGQDHAVTGHPGFDTVAIKVVNDHSFQQTEKKSGKVVSTATFTVAPDGKTGTIGFTSESGASPVTGKLMIRREAKGAPGSNAAAGSWQFGHYGEISQRWFPPTRSMATRSASAPRPATPTPPRSTAKPCRTRVDQALPEPR